MRKAVSTDVIALTGLVAFFIISAYAAYLSIDRAIGQSKNFAVSYGAIGSDVDMQGYTEGFEKTALFFGLMNTAKDLNAHGGISDPQAISGETPIMTTSNNVLFLAPIQCEEALCKIRKRMPFVFYEDMNARLGTGEVQYHIAFTQEGEYKNFEENFRDVAAGKYKFNVLVQVFMLKPGTVTFKICQAGRCTDTQQITKSETRIVQAGTEVINDNHDDLVLSIAADKEDVAVLRQVAVSIYDRDVVAEPNKQLTEYLNGYREKLAARQPNIKLDSLEATFVPAEKGIYGTLDPKQGFLRGIAWAPDNLEANFPEVNVLSRGIAEEELRVRYWRMYRVAEYFVDIVDVSGLMMPRLLAGTEAQLNNDYCFREEISHGGSYSCPSDCTTLYGWRDFLDGLNLGLQALSNELNTMCEKTGFFWKISIPESTFSDMYFAGEGYSSPENKWTTEHSEECNCEISGDPPTETCETCTHTDYHCSRTYSRRFTSDANNLKIQVEITDEKYKTFDSAERAWVNPTFKFFVEFYPIDDNYCEGYACDSIPTGATVLSLPAASSPPPPPPDLREDDEGLFECAHRRADCTSAGGEVVYDGGQKFCRFNAGSCPSGWTQYKKYSTTENHHCYGWCSFSDWDCDTRGHAWADMNVETCMYLTEPLGTTRACQRNTCYAIVTQIGCY